MNRKRRRQRRRTVKIILLSLVCVTIAIAAAILCLAFIGAHEADRREAPDEEETEESRAGENGEEDITEDLPDVIRYEPPEYDFRLDEITVEITVEDDVPAREYIIAFINDLHMITDSAPGDVLEENLPTVMERYDDLSVTPEGVHAEELWPEVIKFLNYNDFDAVIFGGDMLDYCSHSNMDALTEGFDDLKYSKERMIYLRSDHDYGGWYGGGVFTDTDGFIAQAGLWDGDQSQGWIEFDDFIIVGVNKSYQNLSDERLAFLMEKLDVDKPVIVATHVPFYSEEDQSLEERSMEVRSRIYYWNQEDSNYCPDQNTQEFIDSMYGEDSNVVQILAAHLHAAWDGNVTDHVREHIFAPTFEGRIGIVHVITVNKEEEKQ